jgi:hypothetical protein
MRINTKSKSIALVGILVVGITAALHAQAQTTRPARTRTPKEESKFLRFVPDPRSGGGELQTSVVTYRNAEGVTVDLVGAVHIADATYFEELNSRFDDYDAVLFEMVRPRAAAAADDGAAQTKKPGATTAPTVRRPRSLGWIGTLQRFMRDKLELEYQLEAIDYDKPNFVHADLDAETFLEMQEQRGESFMKMLLQVMLREMGKGPAAASASQPNIFELMAALQAPDRARQLKLVLAKQFAQVDEMLDALEGPDGSVILTERNRAALTVLKNRMKLGDDKLAIFYGAGHFKGMEKILSEEMGFKQVGEPEWITAWDLTRPAPTSGPSTAPAR